MGKHYKKPFIALATAAVVVLGSVLYGAFGAVIYAETDEWAPDAWDEDELSESGPQEQPDGDLQPEEPGDTSEPEAPEEPEPTEPEEPQEPELPVAPDTDEDEDDETDEDDPDKELDGDGEPAVAPACPDDACGSGECGEACGCADCPACHSQDDSDTGIAPTYTELENGWTGVASGAELVQAIKDRKTQIRLTADIYMTDKVDVKEDLLIDGQMQEGSGWWTINEVQPDRTLRLEAQNRTVTVRNTHIVGYDYFGFVSQRDTGDRGKGATVVYQNISYTGPQLAWLRYEGTLVVENAVIELVQLPGANPAEEVGEAAQFIFGGNVRINRDVGGTSLFWIYNEGSGSTKDGLIEVQDNATLVITQKTHYMTHRQTDGNGVKKFDFKVGNNATVHLATNEGWCENIDRYIDNFTVGTGSTVTLRRTSTAYSRALSIYESLRVGAGSTLIVEDVQPVVYLRSNKVLVEFDDPALVRLDRYFNGNAANELRMTGKAFNYWTTNDPAGKPNGILNAPQGQLVTVTYKGGVSAASYVDDDGETVHLSAAGFLFSNTAAKRYVMGRYGLDVNGPTNAAKEITGSMSADAALDITYFPWDADVGRPGDRVTAAAEPDPRHDAPPQAGFALRPASIGPNGQGAFAREQEVLFDLARTIRPIGSATTPTGLYARESRMPVDDGVLMLTAAPELLDFGSHAIPGTSTYIPLTADVDLVVTDSRNAPETAQWSLRAKATPLYEKGTGTVLLEDAVGMMREGQFHSFASGAVIWTGSRNPEAEEHHKTFQAGDRQNGLVVRIDPFGARVARYEATITWTLSVGL